MSFNLLDSVKGLLSNDLISKAASALGESDSNVQKAVGGIVPSILAGILNKAGSGDASGVLNMAKDALGSGALSNLGGLLSGGGLMGKAGDMLKGLFGDKVGNVSSMISGFAGIKESSAASLMTMAAPAALGALGKHATDNNLSSSGLLSFLNSQKDSILNSIPSGLNIAGALGLGSLGSIGSKLSNALSSSVGGIKGAADSAYDGTRQKASGGTNWLLPALLLLVAVGLLWYFMRGCNRPVENEIPAVTHTDTMPAVVTAPEVYKVTLPDGVVLDAYKGGVEDQLVLFLNDASSKAGKDVWFDFDNINFKTGSADLTDESMAQVKNIVSIIKAYPALEVKIGGYTDRTGDSLTNLKLSKSRAESVVSALKGAGANMAQVTGAEGYGSQFAKVPADASDEKRKKDRRIAISIRKK